MRLSLGLLHDSRENDRRDRKIVCPMCDGSGTQTLHGEAFTASDFDEQGPEFFEDYMGGTYDHPCDHCKGRRVTTLRAYEDWADARRELQMGY